MERETVDGKVLVNKKSFFNSLKQYAKLMRIHHYLKNGLIFLPIVFSGNLLDKNDFIKVILGFLAFSFAASIVYIINDIQDVESDRMHEVKCKRPIASGAVSLIEAWVLVAILSALIIFLISLIKINTLGAFIIVGTYIGINIMYSMGLKNKPLIDIAILAFGFLLRVIFGSVIIGVVTSNWLYLTVMAMSFYLGLGKRRNEIIKQGSNSRKVLKYYTKDFLDKNMYMCLAITVVFYSLWTVDINTIARLSNENLVWTVPLVILICMKYSLNVEGNSHGDPVDVVLGDRVLLALIAIYAFVTFILIYI